MRRFLFSTAKILVSAALLYLALRKADFVALAERINATSLGWLALALTVALFQVFVGTLRWRTISAGSGAPLGLQQALRYNMIGAFFNQTLPSAIGGDAMRLWLVARTGAGWRTAAYSVFVDRAIGLIALAVLIMCSLPWSLTLIGDADGRFGLVVLDSAALAAGMVFLALHLLPFDLLTRIWATRHFYACSQIASRLLFTAKRGPLLAVLSLSIHLLAVVVAWCVACAIASSADFSQLLLLVPPTMLITVIPISIAGWGVREATMGLAFSYAGLDAGDGVAVSLLFGAVFFLVGGIGGLVWIFSAEKAAKGAAPIEVPE